MREIFTENINDFSKSRLYIRKLCTNLKSDILELVTWGPWDKESFRTAVGIQDYSFHLLYESTQFS